MPEKPFNPQTTHNYITILFFSAVFTCLFIQLCLCISLSFFPFYLTGLQVFVFINHVIPFYYIFIELLPFELHVTVKAHTNDNSSNL